MALPCLALAQRLPDGVIDGDTVQVWLPEGLALQPRLPQPPGAGRAAPGLQRATLRLAGIDAPERHFPAGPPGLQQQPAADAWAATEGLCRLLAARDGTTGDWLQVQITGHDRYGRLLAWIWPAQGHPGPGAQGATHLPPLDRSLNAALLRAGLAYPDLSATLPIHDQQALAALVRQARQAAHGVWARDSTERWIGLDALECLAHERLIWPRLFRRLAAFAREADLACLPVAQRGTAWLAFITRDPGTLRHRPDGREAPFAGWLEMAGHAVRFRYCVENFLRVDGPSPPELP